MYLSSSASTRLALGPGRAVWILGPAVRVLVGMEVLLKAALGCWSLAVSDFSRELTCLEKRADFVPKEKSTGRMETSRYRTDWDGLARAALPDGAAGSKADGASRRASANWDSAGS